MRPGVLLSAVVFAALVPAAGRADYRIEVKGGGSYWSLRKPVLKGGSYTFRTREGTLLLLKKSDVVSVKESAPPKKEKPAVDIGVTSPVEAAKAGHANAAAAKRAPPSDLQKSDAYRPGRGVAQPATPDQYQVGRTLAPPPSGQVLTGEPPKSENPPPPPPPR
jgi:hypothetical protein